jgi:hypothetical protein
MCSVIDLLAATLLNLATSAVTSQNIIALKRHIRNIISLISSFENDSSE